MHFLVIYFVRCDILLKMQYFLRKGYRNRMAEKKAKLPMGIENFMEIRTGRFYYVDKTGLIKKIGRAHV